MNPEYWINEVAALLDQARPIGPGFYCLVADEGKLVLRRRHRLQKYDIWLAVFISKDINEGLSSSQWSNIGCKLAAQKSLNHEL